MSDICNLTLYEKLKNSIKHLQDKISKLQRENSKLKKTIELQLSITEAYKNEYEKYRDRCSDLECQYQIKNKN